MKKRVWVYDIETLKDFFCAVFIDRNSNEERVFEISNLKNEWVELRTFIKTEVFALWGYNNNQFDDVVMDWLIKKERPGSEIGNYAQNEVINQDKWAKWKLLCPDVFRMLHFNRFRVSLKWCEFMMESKSIEEMPIHHTQSVTTRKDADLVIDYCRYDVNQTKKVIENHGTELTIRKGLRKTYPKIRNPYSLSNTGIGKETLLFDYCKITGDNPFEIKNRRTEYNSILLGDIIDSRIKFKTKKFKNYLEHLKNSKVNLATSSLSSHIDFFDTHYELRKGGLHGVQGVKKTKKGKITTKLIYESDDNFEILDFDFGSYYPLVMCELGIAPAHLNAKVFLKLLKDYTIARLEYKKKKDFESFLNAWNLKIKINSIYGLMGDPHSFLFDKKAMYRVTLNGQLLLLMLVEELALHDIHCFYANTDGITLLCPKDKVKLFYDICDKFKKVVDIPQEVVKYKKCFIRDVNNYIIIKDNDKLKLKGAYVYEHFPNDSTKSNLPYNKNASNLISKRAAVEYLVYGRSINKTIESESSIFKFCIGARARSTPKKGRPTFTWYENRDIDKSVELQKTIRYIVSNTGGVLKKVYDDGSSEFLEAYPSNGRYDHKVWNTRILNKVDTSDVNVYDINYMYYQREALKLCEFKPNYKQKTVNQLKIF